MPLTQAEICNELDGLIGAGNVVRPGNGMARYVEEPRKRFTEQASAVALPADIEAVQALVRWANETGTALIPQGGNTGLVGAQVPLSGQEVIVSLQHFNQIHEVDADAGYMSVGSGVTLQNAQEAAEQAGALLPLTIASQGSATIGGVLSSNAGGVQVLAYGNARELCLGVEAVMPDGSIYHGLSALRKDNTGYDLRDLLVGAEGTLGLITSATLKLYPRPEDYETAWVCVSSPKAAYQLFALIKERAGASLTTFELMPQLGLDMQLDHGMLSRSPAPSGSPWYALVEISRAKGAAEGALSQALEAALEEDLVSDAAIASSLSARENMWQAREQMSECQTREGASIKHDVSVPVAAVSELIARGCAAVETISPGIRPCPFGHMGDGNIHFNFSQPKGADPKEFSAGAGPIHAAIYEIVLDLNGSVSAEHGIGQLKVELLQQVKDPVALSIMRKIKMALDPNNIMNPGKMLGDLGTASK